MKTCLSILSALLVIPLSVAAADTPNRDSPEAKTGPRDSAEGEKKPAANDPRRNKLTKIFNTYDKNKDSKVDAEEIANMREGKLSSSQKRDIRKQVEKFDKDEDSALSLEEFITWRNAPPERE